MTETQPQNTTIEQERKHKNTLNAHYSRQFYRKHHPALPTFNGKRYNPKFKWNALVLNWPGDLILKNFIQVDGLRRAAKRLGYRIQARSTNQGIRCERVKK